MKRTRKQAGFKQGGRYQKKRRTKRNYDRTPKTRVAMTRDITSYNNETAMPQRKFIKMKYAAQYLDEGTILGYSTVRLYPSDIFTPDSIQTNANPYGYDEWKAFYGRYLVHGCKIQVSLVDKLSSQTSTRNSGFLGMALVPSGVVPSPPFTAREVMEYPNSVYTQTVHYQDGPTILEQYVDIAKAMGVDKSDFTIDTYGAEFDNNPTKQPSIEIIFRPTNGNTNYNVAWTWTMEYYVELSEPKNLVLS